MEETFWFFGGKATFKVSAETSNADVSLSEQEFPTGVATPLHVQRDDPETFYVLDGEIVMYDAEGGETRLSSGSAFHVPANTPHGFRVESDARLLNFTTPRHEAFFRAAGEPARADEEPPQGPPDMDKVMDAARTYGVEILGPPPGA